MYDLSLFLYIIIKARKMGSQSLLKSYISPPIMYIKGFSLSPSENVCTPNHASVYLN